MTETRLSKDNRYPYVLWRVGHAIHREYELFAYMVKYQGMGRFVSIYGLNTLIILAIAVRFALIGLWQWAIFFLMGAIVQALGVHLVLIVTFRKRDARLSERVRRQCAYLRSQSTDTK